MNVPRILTTVAVLLGGGVAAQDGDANKFQDVSKSLLAKLEASVAIGRTSGRGTGSSRIQTSGSSASAMNSSRSG